MKITLLMQNVVLLIVFLVALPVVLKTMPTISSKYGVPISLVFFAIAAYFLHDFGTKGAGGEIPKSIDLYASYIAASVMTLKHVAWVLVVNFCFKIAFDALFVQSGGFAPMPMAFWLMTALAISVIVSFAHVGVSEIRQMISADLIVAFIAAIVACVCFQRHLWNQ